MNLKSNPFNNLSISSGRARLLYILFALFTLGSLYGQDPVASIVATDDTATESPLTPGTFTVSLDVANTSGGPITVNYTITGTATAGSDYTTLPGTVSIPNGQQQATITLTPVNDTAVEGDETVILTLQSGTGYTVGTPPTATVTIISEDTPPDPVASIVATDDTATESPLTPGTFTVSLDVANTSGGPITVNYTITGTATAGSDYTTLPGTVSIPNGQQQATITLTPVNDTAVEGDETVILTLQSGTGYTVGTPPTATATIISEDTPPDPVASIVATDDTATESPLTPGTFTVSLDVANTSGGPITVNYTITGTATAGSDYTTLPGTVSIPNGQQQATITLTPVNDTAVEGDETVILTLQSGTGYTVGTPPTATVTIISEDTPPDPVASIVATDDTATESPLTPGTFTVSLDVANTSGGPITVNYTITGTATAGSDYTTLPGTVSIPNGQQQATITLTPVNDTAVEGDETVILTLQSGTGYTVGTPPTATVTIISEDTQSIIINSVTRAEGNSGTTNFDFTVSIQGGANALQDIDFDVATSGGSATAGVDYISLNTTGTIQFNQNSATVTVEVNGDTTPEPTETFNVLLSNASGAIIAEGNGVGTILNDDIPTISINDVIRNEGDAGVTIFAFTVGIVGGGSALQNINFTAATSGGNATAGSDYIPLNTTASIPVGQSSATINVSVNGDLLIEGDETFNVNLSGVTGATIDNGTGKGTIQNDDSCLAGIDSPALNTSTPTIFCDDVFTSQNLNAYVTGAPPAGSILRWSTNSDENNTTDFLASPVVSNGDTYYGYFYDTTNDCRSPGLAITLEINIAPTAGNTTNASRCNLSAAGDTSIDLDDTITDNDPGGWTLTSAPVGANISIGNNNSVNFNGEPAGNYLFTYTTNVAEAPCTEDSESVTITVIDCELPCNAGNTAPVLIRRCPQEFLHRGYLYYLWIPTRTVPPLQELS